MSDRVILYLKRAALVVCAAVLIFAGYDQGKRTGYDEGYDAGYAQRDAEATSEISAAKTQSYKSGYNVGFAAGEKSAENVGSVAETTVTENSPMTSSQAEPQSVTVYITRTGEKYHRWGCQYLRQSQIAISLDDAEARGYTACSRCW